ncbi:MAG: ATP-binding protein [Clostridia bacterium]|nr:ATP-binding protein [Clostridia bacterium]
MLVNFRFKNCRSFFSENELNMQAVKDSEFSELNTFKTPDSVMPKGDDELIKSAIIFGANASGKSNVIKAISYMKNVILYSASQMPIVQNNEYFSFFKNANKEESLYEVEFIQNNIYYRYGFTICEGKIKREWLDKRVERIKNIFKREENNIEIVGLDKQATKLINIGQYSLFLSVGNNFNIDIKDSLTDVLTWFSHLYIVFENQANSLDIYTLENGKYLNQALDILKQADIGITKMEVKKDKIANMNDFNDVMKLNAQMQINPTFASGQIKQEESNLFNIDMKTSFNVYDEKKNNTVGHKVIELFKDVGFHSEGTIRLLCYLGWILVALDKGYVIFIDEIDSKLHFLVADYLQRIFNSINKNPNNAQLICTAHNTLLMDEDLRRDQIYFTTKDEYGESKLFPLTDFKNVRKSDLFSKKYLAGFYSKLPDMRG